MSITAQILVVPSQTDRLNSTLAGRYRIERHLGAGGMATVHLTDDLKRDRKVALKVLKPELAAVLGAERLVREIKTTASLQHPHILPLLDSGTADGFLDYVMPFIEGETLRDKLSRETQLGVDEAVGITREVADALRIVAVAVPSRPAAGLGANGATPTSCHVIVQNWFTDPKRLTSRAKQ